MTTPEHGLQTPNVVRARINQQAQENDVPVAKSISDKEIAINVIELQREHTYKINLTSMLTSIYRSIYPTLSDAEKDSLIGTLHAQLRHLQERTNKISAETGLRVAEVWDYSGTARELNEPGDLYKRLIDVSTGKEIMIPAIVRVVPGEKPDSPNLLEVVADHVLEGETVASCNLRR